MFVRVDRDSLDKYLKTYKFIKVMNLYSRARKHIDMNRVKELREEKILQRKIFEKEVKEFRESLKNFASPDFSNWRFELDEGMTSSGMFTATLPATGDTVLSTQSGDTLSGVSIPGYHGIGSDNLFAIADNVDSITFTVIPGIKGNLQLATDGGTTGGYGGSLYGPFGGGTHTVRLNSTDINTGATFLWSVTTSDYATSGFGTWRITNVQFKRLKPLNIVVSLDDPEASAFIRTSPNPSNLSPAERQKKLKEMLEAGDTYLAKMFGNNFPGTGLTPPPGEGGDTPGVDLTDITSDAVDPGMGMGDQAALPLAIGLAASPMGQMAIAAGVVAVASLLGITVQKAQEVINQVNKMQGGSDWGAADIDPSGEIGIKDDVGDSDNEKEIPPLTDEQRMSNRQAKEAAAADKALEDAIAQYGADSDQAVAARRARNNTLTRHKRERKSLKNSYEPVGQVIAEKKKLKSPEEVLKKIPGYYDGKPAPLGFPVEPPPKTINGYHPDLVDGKKVSNRFNRLDPMSARAMPPTGNPHIDKKVRAAARKPK